MNQEIEKIIIDKFKVEKPVTLTRPKNEFGDYSTTVALELAKQLQQSPREVAEAIVSELSQNSDYYDITVAGPGFINFRVKAAALADSLAGGWGENYGGSDEEAGKLALIEYPSNNMAKPYSIGHLRPGNQGWTAAKLHRKMGWEVITDNHLGDYGTPFGVWAVGFLRYSDEQRLGDDGVYELGRIYIMMKEALQKEQQEGGSELALEVQDWLLKLEQQDAQALSFNKKFSQISLDHIHQVMKRLNISTDHEYGEAFFAPLGKSIVKDLVKQGVATVNDDGSVIIDISDQGIKVPVLVQKSNGAALYATTDLATIFFREKEFQPDRVVYAVGDEQSFYFKQLFAIAKKLNIDTELIHLTFGLIDQVNQQGVREKMSSRKGVVLLEELLDTAEEKARMIVESRQDEERQVSDEDIKTIALGAIKFSDFTADRRTNILFDWDSIFSLSGFSGTAVQYAAVRINKILQSEVGDDISDAKNTTDYDYAPEKDIILKLLEYPVVLHQAYKNLEAHKIATYLYELAREMNRYYETTRIKDSPTEIKGHRLNVLKKVSYVFTDGLDILGIQIPKQM